MIFTLLRKTEIRTKLVKLVRTIFNIINGKYQADKGYLARKYSPVEPKFCV